MEGRLRAGSLAQGRDRLPGSSRYEVMVKVAAGGMATVYVGRLRGAVGFSRLVAIKRAHPHLAEDPAFRRLLVAEAKLASKIVHPNVVSVQDVEESDGELLLVMDWIEGASLAQLLTLSEGEGLAPRVATRVVLDACAGLSAAHTLTGDDGAPLAIVHRDVSPHNVLVGADGISRIADFGIAKSTGHTGSDGHTSTGTLKGKVAYMAPEYVERGDLDARSDVFALGVVAWELYAKRRLFRGGSDIETLRAVAAAEVPKLSSIDPALAPLDDAVLAALAREPEERFQTALAFAEALETAAGRAGFLGKHGDVARAVKSVAGDVLAERRELVRAHDADAGEGISVARVRTDEPTADVAPGAGGGEDTTTEKSQVSPPRGEARADAAAEVATLREGDAEGEALRREIFERAREIEAGAPREGEAPRESGGEPPALGRTLRMHAAPIAPPEEATATALGSGAEPEPPRARSRRVVWALAATAVAVIGVGLGVQRLGASAGTAPSVAPGSIATEETPSAAPPVAPPPVSATTATSASTATLAATASPPREEASAAPPPAPSTRAAARRPVAARPAPAPPKPAPRPSVTPAPTASTRDKAPPNPYGRAPSP